MDIEKPKKTDHFASHLSLKILDVGHETPQPSDKIGLRTVLKTNYQLLAQEILREIRGELNQRQLSEQLGYTFNQVGKWETGFTQVKWNDFLRTCDVLQIPIEKYFKTTFWTARESLTPLGYLQSLANHIPQDLLNDKFVRNLNKKWLTGTLMPDFSEVLEMAGTRTALLLGWISQFLDCSKIASIRDDYEVFAKTREAVFSNPVIVYINAALNLKAYQDLEEHDENLLAAHAACTVDELRQALALMLEYGLVTYQNKKFMPSEFDYVFGGLHDPKLQGLAKRTTQLATDRFAETPLNLEKEDGSNQEAYSAQVAALSSEAANKVLELMADFQKRVGEVIRLDQGSKDRVHVLLFQSFPLNRENPNPISQEQSQQVQDDKSELDGI